MPNNEQGPPRLAAFFVPGDVACWRRPFRWASASGSSGHGEVNRHFRQLTTARNFLTQPAAPAFENCQSATNPYPVNIKHLTR
jgi:hypothetical protein